LGVRIAAAPAKGAVPGECPLNKRIDFFVKLIRID
jgi:hypothetical protein